MQLSKFKPDNAKAIVIVVGGLVAVVVIVIFINKTFGSIGGALQKLGSAFGLATTPEQQAIQDKVAAAQTQAANNNSPWNPSFYKNAPAGAMLLTQASADAIAAQIWNSVGLFSGINADEVLGALNQLQTQSQVSYVADRFNQNYNKDMLTWLTFQYSNYFTGTDDAELGQMVNYVSSLPKYNV